VRGSSDEDEEAIAIDGIKVFDGEEAALSFEFSFADGRSGEERSRYRPREFPGILLGSDSSRIEQRTDRLSS
jgi:hypothetical protein